MGMIPDHALQEIAGANDIVETVSSYVGLKKAGKDHKGLCPFHSEKTPSFTVSPSKQIFHCFGCGAGGDVIGFIMKMERMEFPDAIDFLAQKKGIDLGRYKARGDERPADSVKKTRLYEINTLAKEYFQANLRNDKTAQDYLKGRGVTGITARDFGIGWAPPGWDGCLRWGTQQQFTTKELLAAGLIIQSPEKPSQVHDRFRARVVFPLFDTHNRVLGFSGRVLDGALPKYINSPETAIFHKGATLFGLNVAKEAISKIGWVAVCEGPMDMIGVYQAGLQNIVASQGTAFTTRHAKLLKRFTSCVVLCFDGDQAGQMASLRSLDAFLVEGMDVRIAVLPPKEDPDSFVRSRGVAAFQKLLGEAADFLEFRFDLLKRSHDTNNQVGKSNAAKEVLGDLAKIPNAIYQNSCVKRLAQFLDVREEALWSEFKRLQKPVGRGPVIESSLQAPRALPWEIDWVAAVIQNVSLLEKESKQNNFEMLSDTVLAGIVRTAVGQWKMSAFQGIASVSVLFRGEREAEVLAEVASRPIEEDDAQHVYEEGLVRFHKRILETKIKELTGQIRRLEDQKGDAAKLLAEVSSKKRELLHLGQEGALWR